MGLEAVHCSSDPCSSCIHQIRLSYTVLKKVIKFRIILSPPRCSLTLSMVMLRKEVVRFPEREDTGLLPIRLLLSPS